MTWHNKSCWVLKFVFDSCRSSSGYHARNWLLGNSGDTLLTRPSSADWIGMIRTPKNISPTKNQNLLDQFIQKTDRTVDGGSLNFWTSQLVIEFEKNMKNIAPILFGSLISFKHVRLSHSECKMFDPWNSHKKCSFYSAPLLTPTFFPRICEVHVQVPLKHSQKNRFGRTKPNDWKKRLIEKRWCFFQTLPLKNDRNLGNHTEKPSSRQATTPSPLPFPNSASFVCTGDGGFAALEPGGWCPPLESDNIKGWWDYTLKIYRWNPQKSFWKMIFLFKEMFFFLESQSYFFGGSTSRWCQWFSILWWLLQKKYSPKWWWFKWVFLHQMRPKKIRKNNPPTQHIQVRIFPTSKKISPHQTPKPPSHPSPDPPPCCLHGWNHRWCWWCRLAGCQWLHWLHRCWWHRGSDAWSHRWWSLWRWWTHRHLWIRCRRP